MAKVYPLNLTNSDEVILVEATIRSHIPLLVLDTGATNTIIDLNSLLIAGYKREMISGKQKKFETANGIISADLIILDSLTVWDNTFSAIEVFTLDFIKAGIVSGYEGVFRTGYFKELQYSA
jgi:hypothetical protein